MWRGCIFLREPCLPSYAAFVLKRPLRARLGQRLKLHAPISAPPAREPTFQEVMRREGTAPKRDERARVAPATQRGSAPHVRPAPSFSVRTEEGWLEGAREGVSLAGLKFTGTPCAELDLHGLGVASARRRVLEFVRTERRPSRALVLIVVGKGRHSAGGVGVLREALADWLTTSPAAAHVLAFRTAPPERGGSGSVLVFLAPLERGSP
jgi:DNA-nicking Smr family endonuclease